MTTDKRVLFKQLLQFRYFALFLSRSMIRLRVEKRLLCAALGYIFAVLIILLLLPVLITGPLAPMLVNLYSFTFVIVSALCGIILLWLLGAPKNFIKITACLTKISLTNAAGEFPVLMSRTPTGNGLSEIWEFEAYGIPLSDFNDTAEKLEAALDIAIVTADTGSDGRKTLLTVVPHPGPWPKILPWDVQHMPHQNSVVALGENRGQLIMNDFSVTPHLLLAGQTGSGKSVLLKIVMLQFLSKGWQVYLSDYKRGSDYGNNWESRCTFVTDDVPLLEILEELRSEMERRLDLLHDTNCPNIEVYNSKQSTHIPRIAICFDEIAEALEKSSGMSKEEKERKERISYFLSSIARLGRAAGIHLILATQRGSADVLSGQIRSNVQAICGISNENLSILTLGTADAHKRIPKTARGRFLMEDGTMFQGYYSDFDEQDFTNY